MPRPESVKSYNQLAYAMSGTSRSSHAVRSSVFSVTPMTILNIGLMLLAATLLVYYMISANGIAADTYRIKSLQEQAAMLVEENGSLIAEKTQIEDPSSLAEFARSHQMVEAKDVTYLFGDGTVAFSGR
jgi:hypothetical protein